MTAPKENAPCMSCNSAEGENQNTINHEGATIQMKTTTTIPTSASAPLENATVTRESDGQPIREGSAIMDCLISADSSSRAVDRSKYIVGMAEDETPSGLCPGWCDGNECTGSEVIHTSDIVDGPLGFDSMLSQGEGEAATLSLTATVNTVLDARTISAYLEEVDKLKEWLTAHATALAGKQVIA